jgi:hypothetical protein
MLWSVAMLVLPFSVWLFVPAPPPVAPRPVTPQKAAPASPAAVQTSAPTVRAPTRPAAAPAPVAGPAIDGVVEGPDGQPVSGASVTCSVGEQEHAAQSEEGGKFHMTAGAAGCSAVATKKGFAPSEPVELRPGAPNRLKLAPPSGASGNVVDDKGAPVMSYTLRVDTFEPMGGAKDGGAALPPLRLRVDDAEGAFELTDLAPGRYRLAASAARSMARSPYFVVVPGVVTKGVRIEVKPPVTVVGKVVDAATGAPIDDAMVNAVLGGITTFPVRTVRGEFKVEGAPAEAFELRVFHPAYALGTLPNLVAPPGGGPLRVEVKLRKADAGR